MKIELHIERLVLDGFSVTPAQRARLGKAIERELERLAASGKFDGQGSARAKATAPSIRYTRTMAPEQLGRRIAQSVHAALGNQGRAP